MVKQSGKHRLMINKFLIIIDLFNYLKSIHKCSKSTRVKYDNNCHINAYTEIGTNLIVISYGAIQKLSIWDVEALLFHELGHTKEKSYDFRLILIILSAIFLISWNFLPLEVALLCSISLFLIFLSLCRRAELQADLYSSHILSRKRYICFLKRLEIHLNHQYLQNQRKSIALSNLPKATLQCNFWLLCYKMFIIFQHVNIFNVHPTFHRRIKYVEKNG